MDKSCFEYQIYVISDSIETLKTAIDSGAFLIQLRDKSKNLEIIKKKARELASYKKHKNFIFILNDYPELAIEAHADGVHIGQDTSSIEARKNLGANFIIGKTTHSIEQALAAQREGIDYISAGPVYKTPTKPGKEAVGLEYVKVVAKNIDLPFVAIGGINLDNLEGVLDAGAKTIGVVRAAFDAKELLAKIRGRKNASKNKWERNCAKKGD